MQDQEQTGGGLVSNRAVDIVVALIMVAIGAVVMADSLRLGAGWAEDGPQSGYFPFYIGLIIVVVSLGTVALAMFGRKQDRGAFVHSVQLRHILRVLLPTTGFIILVGFIGIYVASAIFIGASMRWLGRFRWFTIVAVSLAVPVALFFLFEIWFLVPLPKGPLEDFLGY
jgi:putative tricarboxylic transport membrane protein